MIKQIRLLAILALVIALTTGLIAQTKSTTGAAATQDQVQRDIIEALTHVEQHYAGKISYGELNKATIEGMLHVLDPHSNYFDPKDFAAMREKQRSVYSGIGATITYRAGQTYILTPFPNAPAERVGLRYGDHVVAINGESTLGWTTQQVSEKMLGPRGTKVQVTVKRPGTPEAQTLKFEITRDIVPLPSISNALLISPTVGYIHLERNFNFTTGEEMRQAIAKLKEQGATSFVLDLRNNPGGLVQEAMAVLDVFLGRGSKLLSVRGRTSERSTPNEIYARNAKPDQSPLVVLINRGSASASEIVAGALQDHDRAWVVGETSFGKGLVQTVVPLPEGAGLALTTAKYMTPSGRQIQRDYSNGSYYEYVSAISREPVEQPEPQGPKFTTDGGRQVYGGGGITPDTQVKGPRFSLIQGRLLTAQFLFVRDLINGVIPGFDTYRFTGPKHAEVVDKDDYTVTDKVLDAFEAYVKAHPEYGVDVKAARENREFVRQRIRLDILTAVYGVDAAQQSLLENDPQVQQALKDLPKAAKLAQTVAQKK